VVLAKSVTPSRIEENRNIIKLDSSDVSALDAISKSKGITRFVYPAFGVSSLPRSYKQIMSDSMSQVNVGFPDKPDGKLLKQTL
jgi:glycerol 2-dehydrogenase (NADP+)